jgi:hypothetical protein
MRRLSGFPTQIVSFWNIFAGFVCPPWRKADIMRDEQLNSLFTPAASAAAVTLALQASASRNTSFFRGPNKSSRRIRRFWMRRRLPGTKVSSFSFSCTSIFRSPLPLGTKKAGAFPHRPHRHPGLAPGPIFLILVF